MNRKEIETTTQSQRMSCNCYEWQHMNAERSVENLGIIRTMTTTEYSHLTALKALNAHYFWLFKQNTLTNKAKIVSTTQQCTLSVCNDTLTTLETCEYRVKVKRIRTQRKQRTLN